MSTTADEPLRSGFHARNGWYFRRGADASVTIWAEDGREVALDPSTWASVVASVSAQGEGYHSHQAALAFHGPAREAAMGSDG